MNSIIIVVNAEYLKELVNPKKGNKLLHTITSSKQPFVFEEIISPKIQDVATEIVEANVEKQLQEFYYKFKAEELIYLLFVELLKRQDTTSQALNMEDVKVIYLVKDKILSNIHTPPKLSELVKLSGMSESKLKRVFKQIFGNSIYSYYQIFRMKEAVYLLREDKLTVSKAGYKLGFSNLSHFSRLFEKHIGMKRKKYSAAS